MEPEVYIPAYLERLYVEAHPDLTDAARRLVHDDVRAHPARYAVSDEARALMEYARIRRALLDGLAKIEADDEIIADEFDRRQDELRRAAAIDLARLDADGRAPIEARVLAILVSDADADGCLRALLSLEREARERLENGVPGFDADAEHFWNESLFEHPTLTAAELTRSCPGLVGWLHANEAIASCCMETARYRAAERYSRLTMRAAGWRSHPEGTALLALARLEDEEGFFALGRELEAPSPASAYTPAELVDDSPWYLLARTILLYKLDRRRAAKRSLLDFSSRCEGGAFFLLNATYMTPYLPMRPEPRESWGTSLQAVWEADAIIADMPHFTFWASDFAEVDGISEDFAARYGF